jgi:hypothetical protein
MELIDKYVPDFSNIILGKHNINFDNYFLLLSEESVKITANPFISILVPYLIKNNTNVILIINQESLHHYSTIAKKFVKIIVTL